MTQRSRLHVPNPPARPGDTPDFSYLRLAPAGVAPRPDVLAPLAEIEGLATSLVRVLDDAHRAVGPWNPHLEAGDLQVGLRHMVLTRIFDDRMQRMQRQGRISFYMKSTGEEAVSVAQGMALLPGDMLFPAYRNQGLYIVRGRGLSVLRAKWDALRGLPRVWRQRRAIQKKRRVSLHDFDAQLAKGIRLLLHRS